MNNENSSPLHENTTSGSAANTNNEYEHGASNCSTEITAESERTINLNDFLDFLKISCEVSGAAYSGRNYEELNYEKLSENRLVNELFGHKQRQHADRSSVQETDAVETASSSTTVTRPSKRHSSLSSYVRYATHRKADVNKISGLHPKLSEKLDYVINEGVLDSVLPFICPVPVPNVFPMRPKKKETNMSQSKLASCSGLGGDSAVAGESDKDLVVSSESAVALLRLKEVKQNFIRRKSQPSSKSNATSVSSERKEPEVIIHVCDEVKNTSRDFSCPQSLLVSKMGYFADVTAGQKLEDMDISVHCDVQIFDWLMRWVKRSTSLDLNSGSTSSTHESGPQLDALNVVPILVSASFLQMEPLLLDCLSFCHARLNEVVRSSTNLSCLNDCIITRLAAMFTNVELEVVRDKKERLTPRLWIKLIQSLCEPEPEALRGHYYSLSGLFRCLKCGKCLTNTLKSYISCQPSNIRLNRWGQLVSYHVRDSSWDMNVFISHLFKELKSWRRVYWKLWGHCHFLYCCLCEMHFPVYQMTWCRFHADSANFLGPVSEGCIAGPTGRYPCCGQQAFRFETLPGPNGCQYREHSVLVETDRERAILSITQLVVEGNALCDSAPLKECKVNADSEPHWSGLSLTPTQRCRQGLLPILNPEESTARLARRVYQGAAYFADSASESDTTDTIDEVSAHAGRRYLAAGIDNNTSRDYSSSSDGCESEYSGRKTFYTKKGKKRPTDIPGRFWSGELSARSNQDHQREFEEKVMKQVVAIVNKKTASDHSLIQHSLPLGGSFVRLEAEWKDQVKQRNNTAYSNTFSNTGLVKQNKNK